MVDTLIEAYIAIHRVQNKATKKYESKVALVSAYTLAKDIVKAKIQEEMTKEQHSAEENIALRQDEALIRNVQLYPTTDKQFSFGKWFKDNFSGWSTFIIVLCSAFLFRLIRRGLKVMFESSEGKEESPVDAHADVSSVKDEKVKVDTPSNNSDHESTAAANFEKRIRSRKSKK